MLIKEWPLTGGPRTAASAAGYVQKCGRIWVARTDGVHWIWSADDQFPIPDDGQPCTANLEPKIIEHALNSCPQSAGTSLEASVRWLPACVAMLEPFEPKLRLAGASLVAAVVVELSRKPLPAVELAMLVTTPSLAVDHSKFDPDLATLLLLPSIPLRLLPSPAGPWTSSSTTSLLHPTRFLLTFVNGLSWNDLNASDPAASDLEDPLASSMPSNPPAADASSAASTAVEAGGNGPASDELPPLILECTVGCESGALIGQLALPAAPLDRPPYSTTSGITTVARSSDGSRVAFGTADGILTLLVQSSSGGSWALGPTSPMQRFAPIVELMFLAPDTLFLADAAGAMAVFHGDTLDESVVHAAPTRRADTCTSILRQQLQTDSAELRRVLYVGLLGGDVVEVELPPEGSVRGVPRVVRRLAAGKPVFALLPPFVDSSVCPDARLLAITSCSLVALGPASVSSPGPSSPTPSTASSCLPPPDSPDSSGGSMPNSLPLPLPLNP